MSERKGTKGLELWCRKMTEGYPGVKVENMTTSWRDGLAFCAIIHHFRPDLIEFDKLNKDDIYHNNELAFRVAEHHLGIPALLEPEDMVEYEVPDRLSILTYLSQFYQTFENQRGKSGARIAPKRPQSSPDHGIVSPASTSPPTKVQVTIGRSRREPCAKCGFPVFIAERLNVGKLLYHRTCFRCARCKSQLTLANYYETENGEFCCETCPDEERQISKKISPESVLTRSLSDEEKTASLQNFSDAPDAYSTHFETALEFPLDGDLKKSSTLTRTESTSFNKARSNFFKTQMENSSESGSEDIPVELPKSKPPPLTESQYTYDSIPFDIPKPKPPLAVKPDFIRTRTLTRNDNSSFPSDEKDTKVISDSVSEQTNDRFVTKDNASSSSRLSVRARLKLFENNEDNKSDVNKFPSSRKEMPLDSFKKKATVVAIDDLEDFDNISKNDISIEDPSPEKNTSRGNKVHSDEIPSEKEDKIKESNIDLRKKDIFTSKTELVLKTNEIDIDTPISRPTETDLNLDVPTDASNNDVIEILDSSDDTQVSHITIDSDNHDTMHKVDEKSVLSYITIEDSPEPRKLNTTTADTKVSDDSFFSAHSLKSPVIVSSSEDSAPRRGYFTAYDLSNQDDSVLELDMSSEKSNNEDDNSLKNHFEVPSKNKNIVSAALELTVESESQLERDRIESDSIIIVEQNAEDESLLERDKVNSDSIKVTQEDNVPPDQSTNYDLTQPMADKQYLNKIDAPEKDTVVSKSDLDRADNLNPLGDEKSDSPLQKPLGTPDEEKLTVSTRPVPAARPKKKIIPTLAERELTGTPECLSRVYVQRTSRNPFDEESEEELGNTSYNPFEEDGDEEDEEEHLPKPKKRIVPSLEERKLWDTSNSLPKTSTESPKSNNPFDDDEDDEEIEASVKPTPVPTPRASKANRPEPTPRDTLSITSRGSHGGSNSSISSGSAFGSARKKKPAPRPPMPFLNSDSPSAPGSSLASPSSSVAQSPNLSGTIRSRKTKRAPLPPNTSTPFNPESNGLKVRHPSSLGLSPIDFEHTEALADDSQKEKNVKDEENRNRQSQIIHNIVSHETDSNLADKSTSGRWKRRKGQAPSRPIPQRRIVKSLPISEIKRELDTIEIQQQGLEKQGVRLEQIIREKCEGTEGTNPEDQLPMEVEDLILQLFELVNEKNELFRRQAELMYLRRQQRLEEEYADVEYQIRCLMLQPEANKSDSDKVKEETLINRLVEIVERRNEIIECLEMDRRREAEEDNSISSQLNLYSAKRDGEKELAKEEKKDKKKKHKKLTKIIHPFKHKKEKDRKIDIDKDVDETEVNTSSEKEKKKKFNLF